MSVQLLFGGQYGYESHQFKRCEQVVKRSLEPINGQGFKERGRQFTFSGFPSEGNFGEGGHGSLGGVEGWKNQRGIKVGCRIRSGPGQEEVGKASHGNDPRKFFSNVGSRIRRLKPPNEDCFRSRPHLRFLRCSTASL